MKKLLLITSLLFATSSFASHFGTYSEKEAILATDLLKTCPQEAATIMKKSSYVQVVGGDYVGGMMLSGIGTTYFFNFKVEHFDENNSLSIEEFTVKANELIKRGTDERTVSCEILEGKITSRDSL